MYMLYYNYKLEILYESFVGEPSVLGYRPGDSVQGSSWFGQKGENDEGKEERVWGHGHKWKKDTFCVS